MFVPQVRVAQGDWNGLFNTGALRVISAVLSNRVVGLTGQRGVFFGKMRFELGEEAAHVSGAVSSRV